MAHSFKTSLFGIFMILLLAAPASAQASRLRALQELIFHDRQAAETLEHSTFAENFDDSEKPTLLVIHGLHESPHYMRHWVSFFSRRNYQVVSIRLPGHFDRTSKTLDTVKAEDWIETVDRYFESLTKNNSKISILGYSTGGTLAARLALQAPERVEKLFLISPALSLTPAVQVSSTFLSPLGLSGKKICMNPESPPCLILKRLDKQAELMLNDGLDMSPQAGAQVGRLIDLTIPKPQITTPEDLTSLMSLRQITIETLAKVQASVYIADSESDDVVDVGTNYHWMRYRNQLRNYLLFKKQDGILHALMARGPRTSFSSGPLRYNPKIKEIEKLFERGIAK